MTKPASYPFLAIAKRYGLDYGDVLTVADYWRHGSIAGADNYDRSIGALHRAVLWPHEAYGEITFANADFRAIQAGKIDWETGAVSAITGDFDTRRKLDLMKPLVTPLLDAATLKPIPGTGGTEYLGGWSNEPEPGANMPRSLTRSTTEITTMSERPPHPNPVYISAVLYAMLEKRGEDMYPYKSVGPMLRTFELYMKDHDELRRSEVGKK